MQLEKVHAFLYIDQVFNSSGGRDRTGFDKGQIKFLFLCRVLFLFGLARADEIPNEADLCWIAWVQKVQSVETQANEEVPYEMLVQVPPN